MVENKKEIAADIEQDKQDSMKPLWLHGVDNLPGFVAKKKNTEKNEAYYTKIILNALEDVEDELIYGDDELERDLHELKTKLISGKMVLVEDTDMQPGDDIGYNEQDGIAGNLCSIRKKEETVAVEKEEELTSETHNHKLVENKEKVIGEEISAEIGGDIKKIQDKDKAAKDIEWKEYQDWLVCRANFEWKKYQDSLSCEKKTEEPASETVRKSTYSAFWKRLRHLKSRRKRKSIVKVITETTIEEFEAQLTKHANDGYKIKYVSINTKAGNSGTGVRYYAVVRRS